MTARDVALPARAREWAGLGFLVLIAALAIGIALMLQQATRSNDEPYGLDSSAPTGLLALRLWLEDLRYEVPAAAPLEPFASVDLIFAFPDAELSSEQARALVAWVREGHTLVLADARDTDLLSAFGVIPQQRETFSAAHLVQAQPLLPVHASPADNRGAGRDLRASAQISRRVVSVLTTEDGLAAVVAQQLGEGTVWHVGLKAAFTNQDLVDGWGRALVIAALRGVPPGGVVRIVNGNVSEVDDVLGRGPGEIDGLAQWLVRRPLGWAALFVAAAILFYLYGQGRRLGPPLPAYDLRQRRAAVEYVAAMANLTARAGHREGVARYQKARLKRRIGQEWRVSAELQDEEFLAALSQAGALPAEKLQALADLLRHFGHIKDEAALVQLVDQATHFSTE